MPACFVYAWFPSPEETGTGSIYVCGTPACKAYGSICIEALVIAGRPVLITLPLSCVLYLLFTTKANPAFFRPLRFFGNSGDLIIAAFSLATLPLSVWPVLLAGEKGAGCSLADSLRDDSMAAAMAAMGKIFSVLLLNLRGDLRSSEPNLRFSALAILPSPNLASCPRKISGLPDSFIFISLHFFINALPSSSVQERLSYIRPPA